MRFITGLFEMDFTGFVPELGGFMVTVKLLMVLAMLAGPILLVTFGLLYMFKPKKYANYRFGFRTYFGMGSVDAWKYTQKLAGFIYMCLGGVLTLAMIIVNLVLIGKDTLTLLTTAAICLVIEVILTGLAVLALNIFLIIRYDRDGYRRGQR